MAPSAVARGYDLPDSAEEFLAERIARLGSDACAWGQLLSLIHPAVELTVAQTVALMAPRMSPERSHRAIERLLAEQLAIDHAGQVLVREQPVRAAFRRGMDAAQTRAFNLAIALLLESFGDDANVCAAAHYMLQAGRPGDCVRLMRTYSLRATAEVNDDADLAARMLPFGRWGESFQHALDYAEQQNLPPRELYPLYHAIMTMAVLNEPRWLQRGQALFGNLQRDVGLDLYSDLELRSLEAGESPRRLTTLSRLTRAALRNAITPPARRGLSPTKALQLLGVYTTSALGVANTTQTFHRAMPPLSRALAPFQDLSPAIGVLFDLMVGSTDAGRGLALGWERLRGVLVRLRTRVAGMPEVYRITALNILQYLEAMECRAPVGDPACLEVADELSRASGFQTHAWQLRMVYCIYVGDAVQAERCRQELEARSLHSARDDLSIVCGSKDVAQAQALSGDVVGLQRTVQTLEATAHRFPQWRGQLLVYRGELARLVGDLQSARGHLSEALAFAEPGTNYCWAKAAAPYLDVLLRLSDVEAAQNAARTALEHVERLGIAPVYRRQVEAAVALVWAASGQRERAQAELQRLLAQAETADVRGIALGVLHEASGRVALAAGDDAAAFERAARGVARVFANYDNPALVARYQRLMDEAERAGVVAAHRRGQRSQPAAWDSASALRERIDHSHSRVRLRRALDVLVEHCGARAGYLFLASEQGPHCVATAGPISTSRTGLDQFVGSLGARSDELATMNTTETALESDADMARCRWISPEGASYDPVLLLDARGEAVGVAMLEPEGGPALRPPTAPFLRAFVKVLAELGDLGPSPERLEPAAHEHTTS